MGTFNSSHVLSSFLTDLMAAASNHYILTSDTIKLALYSATPDATIFPFDTLAKNAYNGTSGQWVTANEITGTNWAAGGITLSGGAVTTSAATVSESYVFFSNTSTSSVTITTSFQGCLIYDSTIGTATTHTGIVAVYFGGAFTVGGGTLAINWGNDGHSNTCVFYITD